MPDVLYSSDGAFIPSSQVSFSAHCLSLRQVRGDSIRSLGTFVDLGDAALPRIFLPPSVLLAAAYPPCSWPRRTLRAPGPGVLTALCVPLAARYTYVGYDQRGPLWGSQDGAVWQAVVGSAASLVAQGRAS